MKFEPTKLHCVVKAEKAETILIGTGATTAEAVGAAKILQEKGLACEVWDAHCLKPFDEKGLLAIAARAKRIITVEDHSVIGGLGSCVAEALAHGPHSASLLKLGIQDTFGESGEGPELYDKHGISARTIAQRLS
jgi:transketolase